MDLLGRAYGVIGISGIYKFFDEFITSVYKSFLLPLVDQILRLKAGDKSALHELKKISDTFSVDSNGVCKGCIGAIDGLAVRI